VDNGLMAPHAFSSTTITRNYELNVMWNFIQKKNIGGG
jgi:hypothetical protein